jgi:putative transposase
MPYRKTELANGEIYHVVIRRNGNEPLFLDVDDYYRGIFSIYELNTTKAVEIRLRRQARLTEKKRISNGKRVSEIDNRDKLVEILAFCLMPNHIHLLMRQLKYRGISKFMNKLGAGYPAYFKKKHNLEERGYFFQGRFVSVHIKSDSQLVATLVYIHTNPLALIELRWGKGIVINPQRAIKFLENYKWSSYQDYLGKKNFPSVTERNFLLEMIGEQRNVKKSVADWIKHKKEIKGIAEIYLE